MSHHIGRVHSSNNNPRSPGVSVETSQVGVEITSDDYQFGQGGGHSVTLQPQDARVLAALLHVAADNVERMRRPQ